MVPLVGRDDAGQQVHRQGPLGTLALAVDGEGDALAPEDRADHVRAGGHLRGTECVEPLRELAVVGAHPLGRQDLAEPEGFVAVEQPVRHVGGS